jgi:hypothetical protein
MGPLGLEYAEAFHYVGPNALATGDSREEEHPGAPRASARKVLRVAEHGDGWGVPAEWE